MLTTGAMIGAGFFAQFHGDGWQRLAEADLVAVADVEPGKAAAFAEKYGIARSYESAEAMLDAEEVDFVDIVTRPDTHLPLVRLAAERGLNIICQKPMAPTWEDCLAMCEAAEAAGVRLLMHENWRWQPWFREARRLMDEGVLGRVFQVSFFWRTGDGRGPEPYAAQPYFREMPRLLVFESLVHMLDTYRFLVGEIDTVYCQTRRINPCVAGEDQSVIQVSFGDGALGLIDGNRFTGPVPSPVAMGTLLVEGDEALLRMSPDGYLFLTRPGEEEQPLPFEPPTIGYKGDSVYATQAHLVACLQTGVRAESEAREYLRTVTLVNACYESADKNTVIEVEYP